MIASTKILIIVRLFPFKSKPDIRENIKTNLFLSKVINIDLYIIKPETILIFIRNAFGGYKGHWNRGWALLKLWALRCCKRNKQTNKQRQWIFIVLTVARVPAELELSQYSGI